MDYFSSKEVADAPAVPLGRGMLVMVLGVETKEIQKMISKNFDKNKCYLANDNSNGQVIPSKNTEKILNI